MSQTEPFKHWKSPRRCPPERISRSPKTKSSATIYHAANVNDEIATYHARPAKRPDVKPYMERLADALEAAGKPDQARLWRDKADPGRLLANEPAPPFTVTLKDGGNVLNRPSVARRPSCSLLVLRPRPCRLSFPYWSSKLALVPGVAVVAVNFGDPKDAIERFAKERTILFALGMGNPEGEHDNPIFQDYHVASFPYDVPDRRPRHDRRCSRVRPGVQTGTGWRPRQARDQVGRFTPVRTADVRCCSVRRR